MKAAGALVCISVVVLDVVAGILGIQGEIAQNEVRGYRYLVFECSEPSPSAFRLGLAAACLLLIAHFIANVSGGCILFASRDDMQQSPLNKQVAVVCLLFSWTLLIVGFGLLILGAMYNSRSRASCSITRHNFLAIGGIVCFIHAASAVAYYVAATAITSEEKPADMEGVAMENR